MLSREIMETTFKIHDHDTVDPKNPFPLVTFNPKRASNWAGKETINRLMDLGVPEKTGMSIKELLYETSMEDFENIIEACESRLKREHSIAKEIREGTKEVMDKAVDAVGKNKNNSPLP